MKKDTDMRQETAELLAPAGSFESLRAAVNAGADAVYIGGRKFGARAYADNPEEDLLLEGIRYAHRYGVKVHMTVNTLLKDRELAELYEYMKPYYEAGLDAAIVQDLGVFRELRQRFPLLPLHASTQLTVTGPESAKLLKEAGAVRVVPARELSLEEVRRIIRETGMEVETFVHGALCYSYSGQCLMSSLIGGRSGNRGRCAQPCRLPYTLSDGARKLNRKNDVTLLSCRDLCGLDILPELVGAGITSLKIEGRMKSPRYTAGVVHVYRKYLDLLRSEGREGYRVDAADRKLLLDLFDRGGQTDGYYFRHNGRNMIAMAEKPEFREENRELSEMLDRRYVNAERVLSVNGQAVIKNGTPMRLLVSADTPEGTVRAEASGAAPEQARNAGAAEDDVRARLMKTGGTGFRFASLDMELDPGLFLPVSALNALRRDALAALEAELLERTGNISARKASVRENGGELAGGAGASVPEISGELPGGVDAFAPEGPAAAEKDGPASGKGSGNAPWLHVTVETEEQLDAAVSSEYVTEISFTADMAEPERWKALADRVRGAGRRVYLCMPQIFRAEAERYFDAAGSALTETGFDAFVIRSLEEPGYLRRRFAEAGRPCPPFFFDFQVYSMNRKAAGMLGSFGASRLTLPVELNLKELKALGAGGRELVAAGRLPMMVSAQCLKKNTIGCDRIPAVLTLSDRRGEEMPVKNHCAYCTNTILNAAPLSLCGMADGIRRLRPAGYRVLLTDEDREASFRAIRCTGEAFLRGGHPEEAYDRFTRGHMKRGVE